MNIEELRYKYIKEGFNLANASAKICQDIILSKISKSTLNKNITIKGGVVMYGLSNDKRRATRDLDMDFIKYSLDDSSINNFINKLNEVNDGISIMIDGNIEDLNQQDYKGKRVNIKLVDNNNFSVSAKLDIGVHKNLDIKQDEFCFCLESLEEKVTLIINSKEQIIAEKLKSLLKFGIRSTRYKDIFDFYYLIKYTNLNKKELTFLLQKLIVKDKTMKENSVVEIVSDLSIILNNNEYKNSLSQARNNWLELPIDNVIYEITNFFESLKQKI